MNLFLSPAWLMAMTELGTVSGFQVREVAGEHCAVGETRLLGQRQWVLFGTPENPDPALLTALWEEAREEGVTAVTCDFNMSRWPQEVVTAAGAQVTAPFGTYTLDLTLPPETLWSGVHNTHRRWIRRAQKEGVEVRWEWEDGAFLELTAATYARGGKGSPLTPARLQALRRHLGERLLLAGAYRGARLEAALLIPYDEVCGYYLHGASRPDGNGAAHFLHWAAAARLRELGARRYDLGGARAVTDDPRLQGIFRFKEGFGGPFVACCYWRKVIRPLMYGLHQFATRGRDVLARYV